MSHSDDLDELAALLPFYANGRLDAEQRARIDAALATMPRLRAELAEVRALQARIKASGEFLPGTERVSPAERLRTLQSRIAAEATLPGPEAVAGESAPVPPPIDIHAARARAAPRRSPFRSPRLGMSIAAGLAIVCIVQAVMLHRLQPEAGNPGHEYVSQSGPTEAAGATGTRFTLRFRADASWSDIQTLCEQQRLRIVRGPEEGRVDVAPIEDLDPARAEALEAVLKRSPAITFVGRQG